MLGSYYLKKMCIGGKYDSELIWEKILKPKQYFYLEAANYIVSWDYSAHIHRKENENYL